jgi:Rrf2 family protein
MKLSRSVEYAMQATLQLAQSRSGVPIPCSQLAVAGNMPERFLLQILRRLVTHGILRSTRGVTGGYALGRMPEDVSLLNVIEAIEGPFATSLPSLANGKQSARGSKLCAALEEVTLTSRCEL